MYSVRIFISSTFSDFADERNILHRKVFPRLEKLCRENHCSFFPIDLRWGISSEDTGDYTTLDICLNEIRRCMNITPRPNFIFLAGDRYGWRPLPSSIPASLFNRLTAQMPAEDRELIAGLYFEDMNAIPTEYCLKMDHDRFNEKEIRAIFVRAAKQLGLSQSEHDLLFASATHRELLERYKKGDFPSSAVCAIRNINNVPTDMNAAYYDVDEQGELDEAALEGAKAVKSIVRDIAGKPIEYSMDFADSETAREEQLDDFAEQVYEQLAAYLREEFDNATNNALNSERAVHEKKCAEQHALFAGRETELDALKSMMVEKKGLFSKKKAPLVVITGKFGSGKTALITEAYFSNRDNRDKKIIRYVGLTGSSASYEQLTKNLDAEDWKSKDLFIDGVDRVDKPTKLLKWLFAEKSSGQIVLTMPDECYEANRRLMPEDLVRYTATEISEVDALKILDRRLEIAGRQMGAEQHDAIMQAYGRTRDAFFLSQLGQTAVSLKSYEGTDKINENADYSAYVHNLLTGMHDKLHLGSEISVRMAGYLLASRQGLSEQELLGILSSDAAVVEEFDSRSFHNRPDEDGLLPYAYFSRVFYALLPLLREAYSEDEHVYRFDRRAAVYAWEFCGALDKKALHSGIADYFAENHGLDGIDGMIKRLMATLLGWGKIDSRYALELPYQLKCAERNDELYELLIDRTFAGMMHARDFEEYLEYWAYLEANTEYNAVIGFADVIRQAEAIAAGKARVGDAEYPDNAEAGVAETPQELGTAITIVSDLLLSMGGYAKELGILSDARIKLSGGQNEGEPADKSGVLKAESDKIQSLLDMGKYDEALRQAKKLYDENADDGSAGYCCILNVYAQSLYRKERYEESKRLYTRYNEIAGKLGNRDLNFISLKWIASCEKAVGNVDAAMKLYDELSENYEDDDKLSELATIYYEQATAGFVASANEKKALEYFDKAADIARRLGNKIWLNEICRIKVVMLEMAGDYENMPKAFADYCDSCIALGPDTPLESLAFEYYVRGMFKLLTEGTINDPGKLRHGKRYSYEDYDAMAKTISCFGFMENAGNINLEDIPDCEYKYVYYNAWNYVFERMPEPLQKIIKNNTADYDFFLKYMDTGREKIWEGGTNEGTCECVNGVYSGKLDDGMSKMNCALHGSACSYFMSEGYSICDRQEKEAAWGDYKKTLCLMERAWSLISRSTEWIKGAKFFIEYSNIVKLYTKSKKLIDEYQERLKAEYENDPYRKILEEFNKKEVVK